jgi:hypothetical protein
MMMSVKKRVYNLHRRARGNQSEYWIDSEDEQNGLQTIKSLTDELS